MATISIRWVIERNPMVTASQVRAYAANRFLTLTEAKKALLQQTEPRLQYLNDDSAGWVDVPTVIIERSV